MKPFITVLLLFNLFPAFAAAQRSRQPSEEDTEFKAAARDFNHGKYLAAYEKFSNLTEEYPDSPYNSSYRFMAARSRFEGRDYKRAIELFGDFANTFPRSRLINEVRFYLGHAHYYLGQYFMAASEYLSAIDIDPKAELAQSARENLMPLIRKGISIDELRQLASDYPGSTMSEQLDFYIARREIDAGHFRRGMSALKTFLRRHPGSKDFKQARNMLAEIQAKAGTQLEIGLLLPATGNYQEYGRSMLEGARLALQERSGDSIQIELSVKDTEGSPIIAAKMAKAIIDEEPVAVVGPLRSESAISAAVVLNERGIPMLSPTASEQGIAQIGPNIFQLSSPAENIGRAVAEYGIREMDLKEFAIIAPDDAGGTKIANAFAKAVYELGGDVIYTSYYSPGTSDFKMQIGPLRDILLVRTENLLAAGRLDTADFWDSKKDTLMAKEDWPVRLDGVFLPGYLDDLKQLIPQVKYHVIRTKFLGGDGWDSEELLREVKPYVDGAVFATDFHTLSNESEWERFAKLFSRTYQHPPDKVAALTYDAVSLVISGIGAGGIDADAMREYLSQVRGFRGASGTITFKGSGRANNGVAIYSVEGKRLATER